jgi:hypothetical protein
MLAAMHDALLSLSLGPAPAPPCSKRLGIFKYPKLKIADEMNRNSAAASFTMLRSLEEASLAFAGGRWTHSGTHHHPNISTS